MPAGHGPQGVAYALHALRAENFYEAGDTVTLDLLQSSEVWTGAAHSNLILLTNNVPPHLTGSVR